MQHSTTLLLGLLAAAPLTAQTVPAPTANTSEWRFTGATGDFVDLHAGPGLLEYADGAAGQTAMVDEFTTTQAAGIPDIQGVDTPVMFFDYHAPNTLGYLIKPQTGAPNNDLFVFTLVYDLYLDANNADSFGGLVNGNCCNTNDAELFLQPATQAFWYPGVGGGQGQGSYALGEWFRIVYCVDWNAGLMDCYVNGTLAFSAPPADWLYDGQPGDNASWILSDNNGEVTQGWIAAFAVTDVYLDGTTAAALGTPKTLGIFDHGASFASSFCGPAPANSSGGAGLLQASGSASVGSNALTLIAAQLPQNQFGYFLNSQNQAFVPLPGGSQGNLCLGAMIGRYNQASQIGNSGTAGSFSLVLDLTQTPTPGGVVAVAAGETWNFQCWYRDLNPMPTSNFTQGLSIAFQQ